MNQEQLLTIWFDNDPEVRSPYQINGCPPMWKTKDMGDGLILFTRPQRTMTQGRCGFGWEEVDGVSWQFRKDDKWFGQGCSASFEYFEEIFETLKPIM